MPVEFSPSDPRHPLYEEHRAKQAERMKKAEAPAKSTGDALPQPKKLNFEFDPQQSTNNVLAFVTPNRGNGSQNQASKRTRGSEGSLESPVFSVEVMTAEMQKLFDRQFKIQAEQLQELIHDTIEDKMKSLEKAISKKMQEFSVKMERKWEAHDKLIGKLNDKIKRIEERFDRVESAGAHWNGERGGNENENISHLKEQLETQNHVLKELKVQLQRGEDEKRKNNIIIHGITKRSEGTENCLQTASEFLNGKLQVNIHVTEARRLGRSVNAPLLICLENSKDKLTVFKNCSKLRGSRISVQEDLSHETRSARREQLEKFMKRIPGNNVQFRGPTLFLNGRPYKSA